MMKWVEVKVPTEWEDVQKRYLEEEKTIYIIGWKNLNENGEIIATIKVNTRELQYFNANAEFDGLAQAMVILAFNDIENGKYNPTDDTDVVSQSSRDDDDYDDVYSLGI